MITNDSGQSFIVYEKTPLVKTLNFSNAIETIAAELLENGKNLFIDADVPNGGMDINLPLISTLKSLDVTITIKYRNYVTSTDVLNVLSQGTDYLDGFAATSLSLTRYDCITFKPHSTGEWLQIGKFTFFDSGSTTRVKTIKLTGTNSVSHLDFEGFDEAFILVTSNAATVTLSLPDILNLLSTDVVVHVKHVSPSVSTNLLYVQGGPLGDDYFDEFGASSVTLEPYNALSLKPDLVRNEWIQFNKFTFFDNTTTENTFYRDYIGIQQREINY